MKNVMSFFTMFPLLGCLCRFLFKVFILVTCHSFSRQPGQTCMFFFFTWHVCHSGMPFIFKTAMPNLHVFPLYMACMRLWHAIHFQDNHAKPACFFFTWHACMFITWKVFFAKPVGYNFSVAILLPCTEHMGIPNIHESHEHIFHAWFLLTGLAQAPSCCRCTGSLGSHWFAATYFYLSWAHQAPMSLQKHTCSNGGNLKISALVITHLEPTYNVMLLGVQVDPGYGAGG